MSEYRWERKTQKYLRDTPTFSYHNNEEESTKTEGAASKMGKKISNQEGVMPRKPNECISGRKE